MNLRVLSSTSLRTVRLCRETGGTFNEVCATGFPVQPEMREKKIFPQQSVMALLVKQPLEHSSSPRPGQVTARTRVLELSQAVAKV